MKDWENAEGILQIYGKRKGRKGFCMHSPFWEGENAAEYPGRDSASKNGFGSG